MAAKSKKLTVEERRLLARWLKLKLTWPVLEFWGVDLKPLVTKLIEQLKTGTAKKKDTSEKRISD